MAQLLLNDYNVGTDLQQVILLADTGQNFNAAALGHLEEVNATQQVTADTIAPVLYGGKRLHRNIYHDWAGNLLWTRYNGNLTALIVSIMNRFQTTGAETYFSLYCQVRNSGAGNTDEYTFQRCVLDANQLGNFTGTSHVNQPLTFRCQSLIINGGGNGFGLTF